jgi:hypothetical protein
MCPPSRSLSEDRLKFVSDKPDIDSDDVLLRYGDLGRSLVANCVVIVSSKRELPFRELAPVIVGRDESNNAEFCNDRIFEAGTASGTGGSRDDGGSTPALKLKINKKLKLQLNHWKNRNEKVGLGSAPFLFERHIILMVNIT